jgi:hydroxypyruvate reductase
LGVAADSDGIDGSEDAAGAIITPDTATRRRSGLSPTHHLAGHDSYSFFKPLDDLLITGPTMTNVNDLRIILIK